MFISGTFSRVPLLSVKGASFFSHFLCVRGRVCAARCIAYTYICNIILTIAVKEMLKLCNSFNKMDIKESIRFGYLDGNRCTSQILSSIEEEILAGSTFHLDVCINEQEYKIGDILLVETEPKLVYGKIVKVIANGDKIFFTLELFEEQYLDFLYYAHFVVSKKTFVTVSFKDLPAFPSCLMYEKAEGFYVLRSVIVDCIYYFFILLLLLFILFLPAN